ncbi:Tetratricopeptide-like helical domain [Phytophthora cactorum]|nr:Tetratricopeptide-like helical domain [Phytophthora cactorum]
MTASESRQMQRVLSAWRKSRGASAKEGHEMWPVAGTGAAEVLAKLRKLGRRATLEEVRCGWLTLVDAMQFKESPLVAKLNSPIQFHGLGNMIYNNSETTMRSGFILTIRVQGSEKAKFSYALCMKKGIGTRKNEKKAFELYKKCAETGVPPAYMNVSNMYTSGTGTQKNELEALKWLIKAAEAGDPTAKSRLGEYYSLGKGGVQKNQARAIQYYKEAATAGIVLAQYNLGYLFLTGDGVPQDPLQAEALFRKAAEKGFVMAMVNLAQMYRTGYGKVPKELETARKWLELAAPHDPNAKELLKAMTEADTTKEIASKN